METLQFVLSSAWNFIGTIILIFVMGGIIANIVKAFAPVQIRYDNFKKEQTDSSADYKKMWSDLISTWNKNKNPGDDKK
jgi:hypothetical protein